MSVHHKTYNGYKHLDKCLIANVTMTDDCNYTIIVTDHSCCMLKLNGSISIWFINDLVAKDNYKLMTTANI